MTVENEVSNFLELGIFSFLGGRHNLLTYPEYKVHNVLFFGPFVMVCHTEHSRLLNWILLFIYFKLRRHLYDRQSPSHPDILWLFLYRHFCIIVPQSIFYTQSMSLRSVFDIWFWTAARLRGRDDREKGKVRGRERLRGRVKGRGKGGKGRVGWRVLMGGSMGGARWDYNLLISWTIEEIEQEPPRVFSSESDRPIMQPRHTNRYQTHFKTKTSTIYVTVLKLNLIHKRNLLI